MRRQTREAYEQTIGVLLDEIMWLRSMIRPESPVSYAPINHPLNDPAVDKAWEEYYAAQQAQERPQPQGPDLAPKQGTSDDAEVIREMLANDEIDTTEAEALLAAIGAQTTEIEFAS